MTLRRAVLVLIAAPLFGCFDVHAGDTSGSALAWSRVRVVDDFESGFFPTWSSFTPWTCSAWPTPAGTCSAGSRDFAPGSSGRAGTLSFDTAGPSYPGAGLYAGGPGFPLDFTGYDELVFTASLEAGEHGSLPPDMEVRVRLNCPSIAGDSPESGEQVALASAVRPVTDVAARKFAVALESQAPWQDWQRIDPRRCLAAVDSLGFEIAGRLPENAFAGTLTVDQIELGDYQGRDPLGGMRFSPWYCFGSPGIVCQSTAAVPTAHLPPGDALELDSPANSFCIHAERVDPTSHELSDDTRNFGALRSLSFAASYVPVDANGHDSARFAVRLGCAGLSVGSDGPGVSREIRILPSWSSYQLSFDTFAAEPFPVGFNNVAGCLEQVDELCLVSAKGDAAVAGTLAVNDLVLR